MVSEPLNAALTPAILGIDAVAQRAGLDPKFTPALSVVAGIALECASLYFTGGLHPNYANGAVIGIELGCAAVGLNAASLAGLSAAKTTAKAVGAVAAKAVKRPARLSPVLIPTDPLQE